MDLRTIKTFKTIERCGSFQRAAEDLKYAQSTITTHIKKLESDLGVTLFDRGKNLELTDAGRLLSEKGEFLLKTYENLQNSMLDLIDNHTWTLQLGVMEPMASYRFPYLLKEFFEQFPTGRISLQIHGSRVLSEMVQRGEIDLAFCAATHMNNGTMFEPLFSEDVGLLVPAQHRLSKHKVVSLADLQNEAFVMTNSACPIRGNFENKMIELGISLPSYRIEVSNMLALKHYVQHGFGIAIVPLITNNPHLPGTVMKSIVDFPTGLTVGMMRIAEGHETKQMKALIQLAKNVSYAEQKAIN